MTLAEAARLAASRLSASGVETPALDARVLAAEAASLPVARVLIGTDSASPETLSRLAAMVDRRISGEPVARIIGRREFWGLDFALATETLVPRPDTETIVEAALDGLPATATNPRVLDLGTGSGCIMLAVLSERPRAFGIGVDLSPAAAAAARRNAAALGLGGRTAFIAGDWASALDARFDLVVSNPPYIERGAISRLDAEVRRHDPVLALDGGADGLTAYRAILADLPRLLAPSGAAVLELGAGQLEAVAGLAGLAGLTVAAERRDLAGVARALVLRRGRPGDRRR